jgi:hypothetical protein
MASIAKAVAPLLATARTPSGLVRGARKEIRTRPGARPPASPSAGAATLATTSEFQAPEASAIEAPASV